MMGLGCGGLWGLSQMCRNVKGWEKLSWEKLGWEKLGWEKLDLSCPSTRPGITKIFSNHPPGAC
jgi:hypothetical protein